MKILQEMEALANFMDTSWITVCGKSFGADSIIGLIPGVGDFATMGVSIWIVIRAWFAFDKRVFRRSGCIMLINCGIDFCIGSIPLAGDIFDIYWKSNVKNVNIVRKHYGMEPMPPPPEKEDEKGKKKKNGRNKNAASRSIPEDLEEPAESESPAATQEVNNSSVVESKV